MRGRRGSLMLYWIYYLYGDTSTSRCFRRPSLSGRAINILHAVDSFYSGTLLCSLLRDREFQFVKLLSYSIIGGF
ncbi:hypothetical protein SERLADRAFT_391700 [Serpula lacrymans var. lacrymans S7.9]|uniref:Uncharacterized protein n=1 Tax=Serpula lacrymans var. lacrymans (strain S7.9) TaxID=578457 RepID=F8NYA8_SERL9|nr:uncharacterized protein SERLADRAFT_391700 [Serpula lacrymans var. lacrymans S7.9]EGO23580.1 hypothetical protein SERLADRAFT_391700 [Serpula lacrymans var. lacrymans S7.9]